METFEQIIKDGQNRIEDSDAMHRDYQDYLYDLMLSKPIKIITGFRRSGKSTLVKETCKSLSQKRRYSLKNILFLNFENLRLQSFLEAEKVLEIVEYFISKRQKKKVLLVFDEIQLVKNWDKLIRTLYELKNTEIMITGSNSDLLSSELSSRLAGRFIELEIQPFSFKEFLQFNSIKAKNKKQFQEKQFEIKDLFYEYIRFGGFPEIFSINNEQAKKSYLEGLISKVILDDVIERFKIRNPAAIEKILIYLLMNIGKTVSFVKIEKFLGNLGYKSIKQSTIIDYVDYLQKCFALSEVQRFSWKSQRVFDSSKKYYSVDVALSYLYHDLRNNFSKRLENIAYLKLKRDRINSNIYYGYDDIEIDFMSIDSQTKLIEKYQVTKEINEKNADREFNSLVFSDSYTKLSKNYLLSLEDETKSVEESLPNGNIDIKQINFLEWLLDI